MVLATIALLVSSPCVSRWWRGDIIRSMSNIMQNNLEAFLIASVKIIAKSHLTFIKAIGKTKKQKAILWKIEIYVHPYNQYFSTRHIRGQFIASTKLNFKYWWILKLLCPLVVGLISQAPLKSLIQSESNKTFKSYSTAAIHHHHPLLALTIDS